MPIFALKLPAQGAPPSSAWAGCLFKAPASWVRALLGTFGIWSSCTGRDFSRRDVQYAGEKPKGKTGGFGKVPIRPEVRYWNLLSFRDCDRSEASDSPRLVLALAASQWLEPGLRSECGNCASLSQLEAPFSRDPAPPQLRVPVALAHSQTLRSASDASANWRWKLWPAPWPRELPVKSKTRVLQS